ncbi:hypothetical protein [Beijerinckia sp. L45]|uniref:hypothetical protein n=1 Tax=Beijerinckia sp. L45 TaxID=1641855 RepID=UPI001FEF509F|nr:hypothetical protein [Beijerinckia sp. L45]
MRYDYLWSREAIAGRIQGKDRPVCLVAASAALPNYVVLLPITQSQPIHPTIGIAIPSKIGRAIGLDEQPSWVVVSEYNVDEWPNAGLSAASSKTFAYGYIPPGLFAAVKVAFLDLARQGAPGRINR